VGVRDRLFFSGRNLGRLLPARGSPVVIIRRPFILGSPKHHTLESLIIAIRWNRFGAIGFGARKTRRSQCPGRDCHRRSPRVFSWNCCQLFFLRAYFDLFTPNFLRPQVGLEHLLRGVQGLKERSRLWWRVPLAYNVPASCRMVAGVSFCSRVFFFAHASRGLGEVHSHPRSSFFPGASPPRVVFRLRPLYLLAFVAFFAWLVPPHYKGSLPFFRFPSFSSTLGRRF